jgi:hypothetical protein
LMKYPEFQIPYWLRMFSILWERLATKSKQALSLSIDEHYLWVHIK